MKNITKRETVREIVLDQVVIDVEAVTVSREWILENYIDENNGMITVIGGVLCLAKDEIQWQNTHEEKRNRYIL